MVSRLAPTTQLLQPAFDFGTVTAGASAQSTKGVRTALAVLVTLPATAISEVAATRAAASTSSISKHQFPEAAASIKVAAAAV